MTALCTSSTLTSRRHGVASHSTVLDQGLAVLLGRGLGPANCKLRYPPTMTLQCLARRVAARGSTWATFASTPAVHFRFHGSLACFSHGLSKWQPVQAEHAASSVQPHIMTW